MMTEKIDEIECIDASEDTGTIENTVAIKSAEVIELIPDEKIMNFLDYIVLMLSQANTVDEIDLIMDDFLSDDIMIIMKDNKELFSILAVIWLDTFERVCMQEGENNFSLKMLWLPILFKELNWKIEDTQKLKRLHEFSLEKLASSDILYPSLVLLFVEGLVITPHQALNNFKQHVTSLLNSPEDETNFYLLLDDINTIGWK